jgi:hypothetical protein
MSDDDFPEAEDGAEEPGKAGRPEHEVTSRSRAQVQVMHAHGIPHRIIAKVIGCAPKTLRKHYREDLRDASLQVEASMGAVIVAAARNGAWGAAKYWLMTNSKDPRWRTPEPHSLSGDPNAPPVQISAEARVTVYLPDNQRDKPAEAPVDSTGTEDE